MTGAQNPVAEISFDLVMDGDMSFVEGTYRLPSKDWQVFIFCRHDGTEPLFNKSQWEGGVSGIVVQWPLSQPLNQAVVENVLSQTLGISEWKLVSGPDSITLR